jgi:type IV pilus assembly protein PilF
MKLNMRIRLVFIITVCGLISCTANLELKKKQEHSLKNFGAQHFINRNYTGALTQLLEAEKIYSKDPELHNALGLTYMKVGKPDLAIRHLKKALFLNPDYSYARNNLGAAYMEKQEWDRAIACFQTLLKDILYNTPHIARSNLAFAYYHKKSYKLAEYYYNEALSINPEYIRALHGLGLTFMALGKYQAAVDCVEKAVKITPDILELRFDLANALVKADKKTEAVLIYRELIRLDKNGLFAEKAEKAIQNLGIKF